MKRLYGVVCATITPMFPNGEVDYEGVRSLTAHLAENGIHCLYPNGTNGESLSLTEDERKQIARRILEANAGRCVVYVQCGAATVRESYAHVLDSRAIGADGAGLMTPVFFPTDDASMEAYYDGILSESGDFPVYAYNIPSRTGNDLSPAVLGRLMDRYPALCGVKYSAPDIMGITRFISCPSGRKADALIGCDPLALACISVGGTGWVSGPAAVFGEMHTMLYDLICAGKSAEALRVQNALTESMADIAGMPEIPAIKYMLVKTGVIACDACRAPLRALTDAEKARLDDALVSYRRRLDALKG